MSAQQLACVRFAAWSSRVEEVEICHWVLLSVGSTVIIVMLSWHSVEAFPEAGDCQPQQELEFYMPLYTMLWGAIVELMWRWLLFVNTLQRYGTISHIIMWLQGSKCKLLAASTFRVGNITRSNIMLYTHTPSLQTVHMTNTTYHRDTQTCAVNAIRLTVYSHSCLVICSIL